MIPWNPNLNDDLGDWDEANPDTVRRFVYHNWLPLLEIGVTDLGGPAEAATILRKYTWGKDLGANGGTGVSPVIDSAGGIGGLLACEDTQGTASTADDKSYYYFHDANGNVGQVLDAADGSIDARYEYDAYGVVIGPDTDNDGDWTDDAGPYATTNAFRFSTKYWDDETGLGYWGYRYYNAKLGRWISRDPIGEDGGINLLCFVGNTPGAAVDTLGLSGLGPVWGLMQKKVCCKYQNEYWGDYINSQRTIDCECGSPEQCCKCAQGELSEAGEGANYKLLGATRRPCCSCRVQLRRMTPMGRWRYVSWLTNEWPLHISAFVKCTTGHKYRMHHTGSGGPKIGSPQEGADEGRWVGLGNTAIVADYCVSCDSAGAVIQKAKALNGCKYGFVQDCHWFTDQLMRELKRSIVYSDDACPSISSRGHDGQPG